MSTTFPTTKQTIPNPTATDLLENASPTLDHDYQHATINDTVEALEDKVGIDGSVVTTSHSYKLALITGANQAVSTDGTGQTLTNITLTNPQMNFGGDATGDMYYRSALGTTARLPIGTAGQIIQTSVAGIPEWIANPSASDASTTVKGVVEIATTAQITAGTGAGETGALLVVPASAVGAVGASKLVQFTSGGLYPAADGSNITNINSGTASYVSSVQNPSGSTNTNVDTTITCGFVPKVITICYEITGFTSGSFRYSAGTARYNSAGTLVLNEGLFVDSTATTGTFDHTFGTTAPVAGTASGTYGIVTLSIVNVTATGFDVRMNIVQSGNPTVSAKFIAIVTK